MKDIARDQLQFDIEHGWDFYNRCGTKEEKLRYLTECAVWMMGELGEFANEVKKTKRDGRWNEDKLKEELVDLFIFLVKTAKMLDMDLKKEYYKKMELNRERFKRFRKSEHHDNEV